jgi:hypothetical protein
MGASRLESQLYFCCTIETFPLQVSENFTVALATKR